MSWRHILLLASNLAALAFLFAQTRTTSIEQQARILDTILQLQTVETRLGRDILRLRFQDIRNYDEVVSGEATRNGLINTLGSLLGGDESAASALRSARSLARDSDMLLDRTMRAYSLLRNAESYFPVLSGELIAQFETTPGAGSIARDILAFRESVALYALDQQGGMRGTAAGQLEQLSRYDGHPAVLALARPEDLQDAIELGAIILDKTSEVQQLANAYLGLPHKAAYAQLYADYSTRFSHMNGKVQRLLPFFYGLQAVTLLHILFLLAQVARANRLLTRHATELETALQAERELNDMQRTFVSMVSHEFRTPLAVIDAIAHSISRKLDTNADKLRGKIGRIRSAVLRLTELIESTLCASRIESGAMALEPSRLDLRELLDEVCETHRRVSPIVRLATNFGDDSLPIIGDPKLLRIVISNLISNAVKYSPNGGDVTVTAKRDGQQLVLSVADSGVGIPPDELERLFDRFYRASTSVGIPGTGIGLHLVRQLVDMHRGQIGVTSEAGVGSTFTIRLPISAEAATDATIGPVVQAVEPQAVPAAV